MANKPRAEVVDIDGKLVIIDPDAVEMMRASDGIQVLVMDNDVIEVFDFLETQAT